MIVPGVLFVLTWLVGFAAWFVYVAELLAIYLLRDLLSEKGFVALRQDLAFSLPSLAGRVKLERAHLRATSSNRLIFASRFRPFGRGRSAAPVKGVIRWSGSVGELTVRHPLGLVLFLRSWLCGWSIGVLGLIGAAASMPNRQELVWGAPIALVGGLFGYGLYRYFLMQGRRSAGALAEEVLAYLRA